MADPKDFNGDNDFDHAAGSYPDDFDLHGDEEFSDLDPLDHDDPSSTAPEDDWESDFDETAGEFGDAQDSQPSYGEKKERNWFNLAVFGAAGLAGLFFLVTYLPSFSAATTPCPCPAQPPA